jgi:hypothetical protein
MWVSLSNLLLLPPTCGFPHGLQYFELVRTMVFLIYNIEQEQTVVISRREAVLINADIRCKESFTNWLETGAPSALIGYDPCSHLFFFVDFVLPFDNTTI